MSMSTVKKLRFGLVWAVVILCGIALLLKQVPVLMLTIGGLGVLATVGYIVVTLVWWRCPDCGHLMPPRSYFLQYCPYCGESLE